MCIFRKDFDVKSVWNQVVCCPSFDSDFRVAQLIQFGTPGFDPWVGKILWRRERLLQYSGLENSVDYTVYGVAKSWTQLNDFHFHFQLMDICWGKLSALLPCW